MSLDDPILRFLAKPENLPLALDISKKVERLKQDLHYQFWPAITTELRERLVASEYADRWYVVSPDPGKEMSNYAAVSINPFPSNEPLYVYPRLEHGTPGSDYHFSYGICWSKRNDNEHYDTEATRRLAEQLRKQGFRTNPWWPGNISLNLWARREIFLLRMANDQDAFIKETADMLWDLFIAYEAQLITASEELAQL